VVEFYHSGIFPDLDRRASRRRWQPVMSASASREEQVTLAGPRVTAKAVIAIGLKRIVSCQLLLLKASPEEYLRTQV
jgi:hypothetical protein